ncbi:hypothetical protein N2152v2_002710 [Parachlorella kessleri]
MEAAHMGALSLQRLVGCGADLVEVVDNYLNGDSQPTNLPPKQLDPAVCGLSTVMQHQLIVLAGLRELQPNRAQEAALKDVLNQRMHWVGAAAALTKVLHCVADAGPGGGDSTVQQWCLASELPGAAMKGLKAVILIMQDVYMGRYEPGRPSKGDCIGEPGGFAMVPGAVAPLLELAELLLRLVAKQPVLAGLLISSDPDQDRSAGLPFLAVSFITTDLNFAAANQNSSVVQRGHPRQSGEGDQSRSSSASDSSSSSSSSSDRDLAPEAEALLQKVASLAGTAAKLGRCLPAMTPGPMGSSDFACHHYCIAKNVVAMCCSVLALNSHVIQAPGLHRSLTQHFRSTGFLPFLWLPALAQAMGCPDLQPAHLLTEDASPTTDLAMNDSYIILQLWELHLLNDAVRGGGLGPLLKHYVHKLLLGEELEAEHTEALALAVAKDGMLQVAADYCLSLARCGKVKGTEWMLMASTVMLLRAVCSVLDENASIGLLTTFSRLLDSVPALKKEPQQDGIFRDVAVSAWTCCNPGCTNMAGQQEASLGLSKCAGCGEARYCSNTQPTVPAGLAAALEHMAVLCLRSGRSETEYQALMHAAGRGHLAVDLQKMYCEGSLLKRFCSAEAFVQAPKAVVSFLFFLCVVTNALPLANVDYAALWQVLLAYAPHASRLTGSHYEVFGWAVRYLSAMLLLQQRLLQPFKSTRLSKAQKATLTAILEQRMQWATAAAAFAKVLHSAADAAVLGSEAGWVELLQDATVEGAVTGLLAALQLVRDVFDSCCGNEIVSLPSCTGGLPAFSKLPGAVGPLVELVELLLRLASKQHVLDTLVSGREPADGDRSDLADSVWNTTAMLAGDLVIAPSLKLSARPAQRKEGQPATSSQSGGGEDSSSSSSSKCPTGLTAQPLLQNVASLAATAVKLGRYLPQQGPGGGPCMSEGPHGVYGFLSEQVAELCGRALACSSQLVESPGPQRSLTGHLQRTGFLAFLCLPALAQAQDALVRHGGNLVPRAKGTTTFITDVLLMLKELQLLDDAVRGGGLGRLLTHYFKNLLGLAGGSNAAPFLLFVCSTLTAEDTEGLAVALVVDGLLEAATRHSAKWADGSRRKSRVAEDAALLIPAATVLLLRTVCAVLDEHASTVLLGTFAALLEDVPPLHACLGKSTDAMASLAASGTTKIIEVPYGPWLDKITSSQLHQQDGMFRDVAVSARTCCSPSCKNMQGYWEASLPRSKQCQRQDWRRHKPICQAIRDLK